MTPQTRSSVANKKMEASKKQNQYKESKTRRKKQKTKNKHESEKHKRLRLDRKKKLEWLRRAKIKADPEAYEAAKEIERARWHKRKREGKIRLIYQLSDREKTARRKKGRESFKRWYQKNKKKEKDLSSTLSKDNVNMKLSKQAALGKAKQIERRKRCHVNNQKLKLEIDALKHKQNELKRKIKRLQRQKLRRKEFEQKRLVGSP
ncbi:uncharacterized protein [Prorops nasuta]|uniref:uncharacterized protein n=1 Tax=Prorops nasuta TaxID=863751 RepID=UPI0034CE2FBB